MTGQKILLLIKRKYARRCRLQSPLMQSEAVEGSSHDFLTKPGQNLLFFKPAKPYPRQIADIVTEPLALCLGYSMIYLTLH